MEDNRHTSPKSASITTGPLFPDDNGGDDFDQSQLNGGGDPAVWAAFTEKFQQVQSVLDRNRSLIQQVNENHQSKVHDNMVKNVGLIQEINGNISKVVGMYSDLSTNFSSVFRQQAKSDDSGEKKKQPPWRLQNLVDRVLDMLRVAEDIKVQHIYREANRAADLLATIACSNFHFQANSVVHKNLSTVCNKFIWDLCPSWLTSIVRDDLTTTYYRKGSGTLYGSSFVPCSVS